VSGADPRAAHRIVPTRCPVRAARSAGDGGAVLSHRVFRGAVPWVVVAGAVPWVPSPPDRQPPALCRRRRSLVRTPVDHAQTYAGQVSLQERRLRRRPIFLGFSMGCFVSAFVVFVPGVVWTNGTYGSRMAWLLAGVLPLLLSTALFAWLASPPRSRREGVSDAPGLLPRTPRSQPARSLFITSLTLFAIPFVLAVALLSVYAVLIVAHYVSH